MNEVPVPLPAGAVVDIGKHPERMRDAQALLKTYVELAARLQAADQLAAGIHEIIRQQRQFCGWWTKNVSERHRPGWGGVKLSADRPTVPMREAEKLTGIKNEQVSDWRKALADEARYFARIDRAARKRAGLEPADNFLALGTGNNEWFTPPQYIDLARRALGDVDLDPATHEKAQEFIQAKQHFTRETDGLKQEWHGRVWLNPPYAHGEIEPFIDKLLLEVTTARTTAAIALTHAYTDARWFHKLWLRADMVCFEWRRVRFIDTTGWQCSPTQGQAFFYIGPQADRFMVEFADTGFFAIKPSEAATAPTSERVYRKLTAS
jgi:ParB family chromosome partitioning protein